MRSSALRRGLFAWCNDVILIVGVITPVRLRQACSTHTPGRCLFLPPQPVHTVQSHMCIASVVLLAGPVRNHASEAIFPLRGGNGGHPNSPPFKALSNELKKAGGQSCYPCVLERCCLPSFVEKRPKT